MFLVNKDSEQDFHNVTSEESYNASKKISPLIIETSNSRRRLQPPEARSRRAIRQIRLKSVTFSFTDVSKYIPSSLLIF